MVVELGPSPECYRVLVELSPDAILVVQDGHVVFANHQALLLTGTDDLQTLSRQPVLDFIPATVRAALSKRYRRLQPGDRMPYAVGALIRADDQRRVRIETAATGIAYEGHPAIMVVMRDVTARLEREEARWTTGQRFAAAFQEAPTAVLLIDLSGVVRTANPAAGALLGEDPPSLIGQQFLKSVDPDDRSAVLAALQTVTDHGQAHKREPVEWRLRIKGGQEVWVQGSMAHLPGEPKTLVMLLVNVTERRAKEARLAYRALHDQLTGLPNRALLTDRLQQAVKASARDGGVAVLFVDLDDFKEINDSYGHAAGDSVLVEVARRLRAAVRPADTVARLGGDEYAIVAEGLSPPDALALTQRVRAALLAPIGDLTVAASVGSAHSTTAKLDADALLDAADADMYRGKGRPRRVLGRLRHGSAGSAGSGGSGG